MYQKMLDIVKSYDDEMFDLLASMIKIPSESGNEKELAEFLRDYCTKLGFDAEIDRHGNLLVLVKGNKPGKRIAYNNHLDTVPIGEGWTKDPLGAEIIDGKMYGRGSTDCECGMAAQIIAAKALVESGIPFAGEIALMYPVDEEVQDTSRKGTRKMLEDGFTADMCVNGEDVDLHCCLVCAGMLEVKVTTKGVGAHGATPFKGKNAIGMMMKVYNEIQKIEPGKHKLLNGSINPGVIEGGERSSVVPARCTMRISRFTVPGETGQMFLAQVNEIIEKLKAEDPDFDAEAELTYDSNPSEVAEDAEIVKAVVDAHAMLGKECPFYGTPQHDDADYMTNMGGIPTVLYGPGTGLMAHMPDEYVIMDEVREAAQVYALINYNVLAEK